MHGERLAVCERTVLHDDSKHVPRGGLAELRSRGYGGGTALHAREPTNAAAASQDPMFDDRNG